jgi:hypothetical protein
MSRRRRMEERALAAMGVPRIQAPPAIVFLHAEHVQMPTAWRLTVCLPQKGHVYLACCVISIFLICLRAAQP